VKDFSNSTMLELATLVAKHLQQKDIKVVLVGGLAVEIYTENLYLTKDIDMVNQSYNSPSEIRKAMAEIGFHKQGRVYANATTDICVAFPSGPLSVGDQLIQDTTTIETDYGELPILIVADVVKDRLAAYFHWGDRQSLTQALTVMRVHTISPPELKVFCDSEGKPEQFEVLEKLWRQIQENKLSTMEEVEALIVEETVTSL
jgi:hypothetical protein